MAFVLFYATLYVIANFVVDLAYGVVDPRIRYD
jgi:ABC-type dipeptide/oligopeptide/nickel transport system permease component